MISCGNIIIDPHTQRIHRVFVCVCVCVCVCVYLCVSVCVCVCVSVRVSVCLVTIEVTLNSSFYIILGHHAFNLLNSCLSSENLQDGIGVSWRVGGSIPLPLYRM